MKENILRSIIQEELSKALTEIAAKFQEGDTFIYMGQKHIVLSDNGYTIKSKLPDGKIKNYNYNQIKNSLAETVVLAKADKIGRVYLRGIASMISDNPDLPLRDEMKQYLQDKGLSSLDNLSTDDAKELNVKIRNLVAQSNPINSPSESPKINPYDSPGGRPSKGYMGATYTGD
jgi:hypothetical protein